MRLYSNLYLCNYKFSGHRNIINYTSNLQKIVATFFFSYLWIIDRRPKNPFVWFAQHLLAVFHRPIIPHIKTRVLSQSWEQCPTQPPSNVWVLKTNATSRIGKLMLKQDFLLLSLFTCIAYHCSSSKLRTQCFFDSLSLFDHIM